MFKSYPAMKPVVKCALSIFTGPRVEQSFRIMNEVICPKTNRLHVSTFAAIQMVKYDLQAHHQSAIERYRRKDKLKSPVDTYLCKSMQTAYRRHKEKEAKKQSKWKELCVKEQKSKTTKKKESTTVHKIAERIRQQQRARQAVLKKKRCKK